MKIFRSIKEFFCGMDLLELPNRLDTGRENRIAKILEIFNKTLKGAMRNILFSQLIKNNNFAEGGIVRSNTKRPGDHVLIPCRLPAREDLERIKIAGTEGAKAGKQLKINIDLPKLPKFDYDKYMNIWEGHPGD
jgi:hypothetical protein